MESCTFTKYFVINLAPCSFFRTCFCTSLKNHRNEGTDRWLNLSGCFLHKLKPTSPIGDSKLLETENAVNSMQAIKCHNSNSQSAYVEIRKKSVAKQILENLWYLSENCMRAMWGGWGLHEEKTLSLRTSEISL